MTRRITGALAFAGAFALVGALTIAPAGAGGNPHGEPPGQARQEDRQESGSRSHGAADRYDPVTEDNDRNDGGTPNNVADDGDNAHPSGRDRSVEPGGNGNQGAAASDPDDDGRGPDRTNGGPDKPDGSGGVDLADQDGNNGCGNDDDFEDDNEGWCGSKPTPARPGSSGGAGAAAAGATRSRSGTDRAARPHAIGPETARDDRGDAPRSIVVPDRVDRAVPAERVASQEADEPAPLAAAFDDGVPASRASFRTEVMAGAAESGAARTVTARSGDGAVLARLAEVPVVGPVAGGALAVTGASTATLLLAALLLLGAGAALVRASRRRATVTA